MNYRKVKKLLGMLLVVAMLLPMIPVSPVYADTPTDWQVLGNGAFPPQSTSLTSLPVDGGTTYAAVTVGTSKTAVYRLDESGNGQIGSDLEYTWNGSLYADNDTLYFAYLKGDSELKLVKYNLNDMGGAWETLGTPTILTMTNEISLYAHNGILYVVYAQGGQAKLARYDEAGGGFSEIGSFANGYARSLSLKGDGDGNLYVSYIEVGYVNVKKLSSGGSTLEQVGGAVSDFGTDASLFVYGGTPYVAFTNILNSQDQKCVVKKFEGDSWLTVGSGDGVSNDIAAGNSLYIDDEGTPYVAYEGGNGHNATVYRLENTSWVPVGYQGYASTGSASHLSLAVYDGIAYLAYGDAHNGNAPVVRWHELPPSSVWETVGSGPRSSPYANFTSLFMNDGIPYLAFSDQWDNANRIVAEKFVGNQWEVVLNRYFAKSVQDGAVYVDENTDTPYMAYVTYDAHVEVLKMVNSGGVIDWNMVGSTTSLDELARGLSLYVHNGVSYVAYADMANDDSPVVKMFASGSNVPVPVGDVGETLASYVSMKGDAAGNLYLVFESSPSDRIKVMKKPYASDTWSMVGDFVSPGRTYGPSLYLYDDGSGNVTPYVAYADAQSGDRPIVRKLVGDEWVTVGDDYVSEDFAWETSLYVDEDGTPYVAYVIGEGEYSRVFKLDNNSWVPVGGNGYASDGDSSGISLAVWNGVPYLSYADHENEGRAVVRRYAPFGIAPTISAQPSHQTVTAGQTATFTVAATGDAPLSYQWKKDGTDIPGATASTLTITDAQASDAGSYTCYVSNA
ncbi:MAG: immunoglobulin domain-containing protein, partial [Bacillota bacterium]